MSFSVKGWCPGAYHPMMSGDGLVVRVRPRLARLSATQTLGLCAAAQRYGAGLIELTNRANIQIRGVTEASWPALIDALGDLGLLDDDPVTEGRRNILATPFWTTGDDTHRLCSELMTRLDEFPVLPAKMGFAVDTGTAPVLTDTPADFRLERSLSGSVILRAEGHSKGLPLTTGTEINALIGLAEWFVASGGTQAGRMARHNTPLPDWAQGTETPAPKGEHPTPGAHALGAVHGFAFGQAKAADLARAMTDSGADAFCVTPWRVALLMGGTAGPREGLLWGDDAPELRVDACPGAPFCPQASVETRALARSLAAHIEGRLHVSGCAKGCARATPADVVLTGDAGLFDISFNAHAGKTPAHKGLTSAQVLDHFGAA